jgi:enoyl-CoA hydratase
MARPEYRNAQSAQLLRELDAAFSAAADDPSVRVIVLAGEGDAFSSGHDLGTPEQAAWRAARDAERPTTEVEASFVYSWDHFLTMSLRWRDIPKPTIAMVHGWCIFGGWLVASSMDLIVAADDARFMTAMLQYFPLPFDVGPRKAKELLFDAHEIGADEAHELGFVNRVVPRGDLEAETMALAGRIAESNPFYLRLAKLAVNNAQDAMGFRASMTSGHAHYHLSEVSQRQWARKKARERGDDANGDGLGGEPRRMPLVDKMLRRSGES